MKVIKACTVKSHLLEQAVQITLNSDTTADGTHYKVLTQYGVNFVEYEGTNLLAARVAYANMVMEYSGANL